MPRLLIVDDEPAVLRCLERVLRGRYEVTTVQRADAALILMTKRHFDAILVDVNMPGMRGDELAQVLSPERAARVVLMSGGFVGDEDKRVLAKPLSLAALFDRLDDFAA
jgi:CheY-like chemotaxis protein